MKLFGSPRDKEVLVKEMTKDPYMLRKIPSNDINTFFDIGAQVGLVSVLFRLWNHKASMFALEPDPVAFEMLKDNTAELNVFCLRKALGDGGKFALNPPEKRTTLGVEYVKAEEGMANMVESVRLPALMDEFFVMSRQPLDYSGSMFKIDCEGGEAYIFDDVRAVAILQKAKIIAFELHRGVNELAYYFKVIDDLFKDTHTITLVKQNKDRTANMMLFRKDLPYGPGKN